MTEAEILSLLEAHQCSPWPRRDKETGTNLSTMRCRECGEVAASPDPLPGARESHKHQASILAANGLSSES